MSYRVKPEDVPEDMHEICDGMLEPKHIASVINAAIDLELVSPPVLCMRFQGVLQRENCVPMVCVDTPKMSPQSLISYEHWKGQTE